MIALSIRQPWAWLIIHAGKDIENRSWHTQHRGRFLVHAAQGMTKREYGEVADFLFEHDLPCISQRRAHVNGVPINPLTELPDFSRLERGGVIGSVELVDCTWDSPSPWYSGNGSCGFMLRNPRPLPFTPYKGRLGFFDIPGVAP